VAGLLTVSVVLVVLGAAAVNAVRAAEVLMVGVALPVVGVDDTVPGGREVSLTGVRVGSAAADVARI
jgi:hypothetical protein